MSPNFCQNDYTISLSWPSMRYKINEVVILRHPIYSIIIKRIQHISDDGNIWVTGDNPKSTSSLALGVLHKSQLLGKVIWRIPKQ